MADSIFLHIGGNRSIEEMKFIERDYGGDLNNKELNDDYYLDLYPEPSPTFNSWLTVDEKRELIKNITNDKERKLMK